MFCVGCARARVQWTTERERERRTRVAHNFFYPLPDKNNFRTICAHAARVHTLFLIEITNSVYKWKPNGEKKKKHTENNAVNGFCYTHRFLIKEVGLRRWDDGANRKNVCMKRSDPFVSVHIQTVKKEEEEEEEKAKNTYKAGGANSGSQFVLHTFYALVCVLRPSQMRWRRLHEHSVSFSLRCFRTIRVEFLNWKTDQISGMRPGLLGFDGFCTIMSCVAPFRFS